MSSFFNFNDNNLVVDMDGDFDVDLDRGHEGAAAIAACLSDDAAHLRLDNPESEIAANMDAAANLIEQLQALFDELEVAKDGAYLVPAGWLSPGMHLVTAEEVHLAKEAGLDVYPIFKVKGRKA